MKIPKYIYNKMVKVNSIQVEAQKLSQEIIDWLQKNGVPEDWENDVFIDTIDYGHGSVDSMLDLLGWTVNKQTK